MLVPEAPLDAYRTDLARDKSREDFGGADTVWLLTAHCLSRVGRSTPRDLPSLGTQCASALRDFTEPSTDGTPTPEAENGDLLLVVEGFANLHLPSGCDALIRGVRGMATRMADAGALSMAYTTGSLTRRCAEAASSRERGLLAADLAMIARLLGDLEAAEELYRVAESIGDRAADLTVMSRAFIGRGVIDRVRGNYPRSRVFFERALELSETVQAREITRLAHQGLTICHAMARNFDRGLQHGWATLQLAEGNADREAEALTNLAQLCLDSGFPAAALRAYAGVLARALSPRVALSALGGAAIAAAHAAESAALAQAAGEVSARVRTSGLPYENAQALFNLAMAYAVVGDDERRDAYIRRTRQLAKSKGFFELLHKTDPMELEKAARQRAASVQLTRSSQNVVTSLSEFDVGYAGELLALSGQSHPNRRLTG
jgi:tetratricopeptide (TPR) repeat protein